LTSLTRFASAVARFGGLSTRAGVGTVIVTSFRLFAFLPLRAQWIARIMSSNGSIILPTSNRRARSGAGITATSFLPETRNRISGTLVRDVIEYEVGFGWLGAFADSMFVQRQMRSTFGQRQQILPQLLLNTPAAGDQVDRHRLTCGCTLRPLINHDSEDVMHLNRGRIWLAGWREAWSGQSGVSWSATSSSPMRATWRRTECRFFLKTPRYPLFAVQWIVLLLFLAIAIAHLYAWAASESGPWTGSALKIGFLAGFLAGFPGNFAQEPGSLGSRPTFWLDDRNVDWRHLGRVRRTNKVTLVLVEPARDQRGQDGANPISIIQPKGRRDPQRTRFPARISREASQEAGRNPIFSALPVQGPDSDAPRRTNARSRSPE